MFHTQEEWYKAEYTLPTFFGSLTSHTYRLWSLYTQESHWLVGSKVKAIVSGYFASAIPEKRRLHKERTAAWLTCTLGVRARRWSIRAPQGTGEVNSTLWHLSTGRGSSWLGRSVSWTTRISKEAWKSQGKGLSPCHPTQSPTTDRELSFPEEGPNKTLDHHQLPCTTRWYGLSQISSRQKVRRIIFWWALYFVYWLQGLLVCDQAEESTPAQGTKEWFISASACLMCSPSTPAPHTGQHGAACSSSWDEVQSFLDRQAPWCKLKTRGILQNKETSPSPG